MFFIHLFLPLFPPEKSLSSYFSFKNPVFYLVFLSKLENFPSCPQYSPVLNLLINFFFICHFFYLLLSFSLFLLQSVLYLTGLFLLLAYLLLTCNKTLFHDASRLLPANIHNLPVFSCIFLLYLLPTPPAFFLLPSV